MKIKICKCGKPKDHRSKQCRACSDLEASQRPCKGCGRPDAVFGKRGNKRRARCKKCEAEYAKQFRKTNPEIVKQRKKKWAIQNPDKVYKMGQRHGWKSLGLNPDDIEKRLSNHNGLCEICGQPSDLYKRLCADHSHTTKKFRGFLCYKCNLAIGQFNDNVDLLMKAADYLKSHS